MGKRIPTNEPRRTVVFDNGERLDLHGVEWFDPSGTYLRVKAAEGLAFINPDRVLFHLVKEESRPGDEEKDDSGVVR